MFDRLKPASRVVKFRYLIDKEVIDNVVFRFHYRLTWAILMGFYVLCTANNLIGKSITCIGDKTFKENLINTYCWIASTFTIPEYRDKPYGAGTEVVAPGVGPYHEGKHTKEYHTYYQWVPFMLCLQALLFYTPHWLWKNWEDGRIRAITKGLRGSTAETQESIRDRQAGLIKHIIESMRHNNMYGYFYILCEALNFANVVGNIYFIDKFLGNTFLTYGTRVINFINMEQKNRTDPMIAIFPRLTKCSFNTFGYSGSIQPHDILCVLPINILNEKIYIFLWFWFIILSFLSGLALLYSIVPLVNKSVRVMVLQKRCKFWRPDSISAIMDKAEFGDFLLLRLLSRNMSTMTFHELVNELASKLGKKSLPP